MAGHWRGRWLRSLSAALTLALLLSARAGAADLSATSPQAVEPAAAGTTGESSTLPRLVIIIDDIGNHLEQGRAIVDLPGKLSIAVLPHTPHGAALAERAHRQGKEVLLHAPMSSRNGASPGPGALTPKMSEAQLREALAMALGSVPHIRGVNNHMGSEMTASAEPMRWLMKLLRERDLYFVDSRTHKSTVAAHMAAEAGLPHLSRQVFLDNQRDKAFIEERLEAALARAQADGVAVAIGHPYPETAAVLQQRLPGIEGRGVKLSLASEVLVPGSPDDRVNPLPAMREELPGPITQPHARPGSCLPGLDPRPPLRQYCTATWPVYRSSK